MMTPSHMKSRASRCPQPNNLLLHAASLTTDSLLVDGEDRWDVQPQAAVSPFFAFFPNASHIFLPAQPTAVPPPPQVYASVPMILTARCCTLCSLSKKFIQTTAIILDFWGDVESTVV